MEQINLHGAFRSGTNYVKALLELNYDVQLLAKAGGWKHAPVPASTGRDQRPIVGVVRDPWVWLTSLWSYTMGGPGGRHIIAATTWRKFLDEPIIITDASDERVPSYRFASPVEYWNAMAENLLSIGDGCYVVLYEDALHDPEATCRQVSDAFALERRTSSFVRIDRRTRNMVDRQRVSVDDYVTDEPFSAPDDPAAVQEAHFSSKERSIVERQLAGRLLEQLRKRR